MANLPNYSDDYYYCLEYDAFMRELEQSGIPLWVYYSYYSFSYPQPGDRKQQDDPEDNYYDDQQTLGI